MAEVKNSILNYELYASLNDKQYEHLLFSTLNLLNFNFSVKDAVNNTEAVIKFYNELVDMHESLAKKQLDSLHIKPRVRLETLNSYIVIFH